MAEEKRHLLTGILICSILCSITLFVYSHRFVNTEVIPKWLGLLLSVGVTGIVYGIFSRKIFFPALPVFLLLIGGFLLVFIRDWVTLGFDPTLLTYLCGLVLLFFIVQNITAQCPPKYLCGVIIVFALAASLHGILQHAGAIHSGKGNFSVTGRYDSRTNEELQNEETRQGETPKVQPNGAALPP